MPPLLEGVEAAFLETCLAENDRRLARYDPCLLRPRAMPALVRAAKPLIARLA